jgi:hypothetical protein
MIRKILPTTFKGRELKQKSPEQFSAMGFLRDILRRSKKILLIDSPHTQ